MRRPGCVAQPLALVARRELEELLERAGCRVDSGMAIAERREALWHRRQGKVRGIGGIHFVPLERRRDPRLGGGPHGVRDRKSTRLNSSHLVISYAVFCLKKKQTYL